MGVAIWIGAATMGTSVTGALSSPSSSQITKRSESVFHLATRATGAALTWKELID